MIAANEMHMFEKRTDAIPWTSWAKKMLTVKNEKKIFMSSVKTKAKLRQNKTVKSILRENLLPTFEKRAEAIPWTPWAQKMLTVKKPFLLKSKQRPNQGQTWQ